MTEIEKEIEDLTDAKCVINSKILKLFEEKSKNIQKGVDILNGAWLYLDSVQEKLLKKAGLSYPTKFR
jgi:hypothetical protein